MPAVRTAGIKPAARPARFLPPGAETKAKLFQTSAAVFATAALPRSAPLWRVVPMSNQSGDVPLTPPPAREALLTAGAGLVVAAFCLSLLLVDRGYFWRDDFQTYQLAGYQE